MVNGNESIHTDLSSENLIIPKPTKRKLTIATNNLTNQINLVSNEKINSPHQNYKPSPRTTPRTAHLSLPTTFITNTQTCNPSSKLQQSHMSLPLYLSNILPTTIQNWGKQTRQITSHNAAATSSCIKNIKLMADYTWGQTKSTENMTEFIDELVFLHDYYPSVSFIDLNVNLPKVISELIYLIHNKPTLASSLINKNNIPESIKKIDFYFTCDLKKAHERIKETHKLQISNGLFSAKKAKHMSIPIAISRILIPPVGSMLEALIPSIIEEFVNEENPYSHSLKSGLNLICQSDELKAIIDEIRLPEDNQASSNLLIKATLNLAKTTTLKDYHAKIAALSALLTHIRQGQTGSCFASFIAIALQSINPQGALLDFKQLLSEGKLSRRVDKHNHGFPYLMKIEIPESCAKWVVTRAGKISTTPVIYLWDVPGIQSICHYLSISCSDYLQEFVKQLCPKDKTVELTLDTLIDGLVTKYGCEREHLEIVFASSVKHPLLSIWENSIAGMAEGLSGGMLKTALIHSIQYFLRNTAKKNGYLDVLNKYEILDALEHEILQRSHYLYDPTLALKNILKGAFVLHDSDSSEDIKTWTKPNNPEAFLKYLHSIIETTWLKLNISEAEPLKIAFQNEINDGAFISSLLKRYHRENQNMTLSTETIKLLRYTPWISSIGNDPQMVLKVYHETENTYEVKQFTPKSADELLLLIQQTLEELPHGRKKKYLSHGAYVLPMRIKGVHIFSLLLCHPTMQPFLIDSKASTLQPNLIQAFSKLRISSQVKNSLLDYCRSYVDKKQIKQIEEKISALPKKCSCQELRSFLIDTLMKHKPALLRKEDLIHEIDLKILDALPKNIRESWENSIVHFADTNWQSDIQDIHYGIGINPGTGKTELMSVLGNKKIYKFLDQDQFLKGKVWELYLDS